MYYYKSLANDQEKQEQKMFKNIPEKVSDFLGWHTHISGASVWSCLLDSFSSLLWFSRLDSRMLNQVLSSDIATGTRIAVQLLQCPVPFRGIMGERNF